jgi:site-specific DNA recombinase
MKNVILYVRVSTDEQASKGYSLRDQEQKLVNYCKLNNLNILEIYREDYSAKTFKRPVFNKLLDFCKKNKKDVHQLIFIKWDRFSRNTSESYQMIEIFERLSIQVNAIEQPLDLTVPEQGLMLAVYLSIPQVENHRRSLNIISGMRRAFKEGRYVGSAPRGYDNGRDASKKPILIPNNEAKFIQEAFELIASGLYNQAEVLKKLRSKGFVIGKTSFSNLIKNPIYYGGVFIKAYKDEEEVIVEGIHEPIITKSLFLKAQGFLINRRKKHHVIHKKINESYPLKGFLLCPECNAPLTASTSKGRSKYYSYYHCISPCKGRYQLEDVNLWIGDYLNSITLNAANKKLLEEMIVEAIKIEKDKKMLGPKHYERVAQIEVKMQRLQDLYIDGEMDKKEYEIVKKRYQNIYDELKELEIEAIDDKEVLELYKKGLNKVENIENQYIKHDIEDKRQLLGSIFPKKIRFENKKVRTADVNPFFLKIASINAASRGKKKGTNLKKIDLSRSVNAEGFEPSTACLEGRCSIQLSYASICRGGRIRTCGLLLPKQAR